MRNPRQMSIIAAMATTGTLVLSACSSVDQEKDFRGDLKTLGYKVVSVDTDYDSLSMDKVGFVESTSRPGSKSTPGSNSNSGKSKTGKSASSTPSSGSTKSSGHGHKDKDELEAIVKVAGCNVELDRQTDASVADTVKKRDIETFTVDVILDNNSEIDVTGGPTGAPSAAEVAKFIRAMSNRPACVQ